MAIPPYHSLYKETVPNSESKNDFRVIEQSLEANSGFVIGNNISPVFFTSLGHNVRIEDSARGSNIIICGPDSDLPDKNFHCYAVEDGYKKCHPTWWTGFRHPAIYTEILKKRNIFKLLPSEMARQSDNNLLVQHYPFVFYFRRHVVFIPTQLMSAPTIWHSKIPGSEVLSVVQICAILGYRNIYITGFLNIDNTVITYLRNSIKKYNNFKINLFDCGNCKLDNSLNVVELDKAIENCT